MAKISIIGTGYVGLCSGVGLASLGHNVICVDVDSSKVEKVNNAIPIIYEKDLEEKLKKSVKNKKFRATTNYSDAIQNSDITFICVGTPSKKGKIDLTYIVECSKSIGRELKNKNSYHVVVVKSTVLPQTSERVASIIEKESGKKQGIDFGVCMNPEFLREGMAIYDFENPDRIVIGSIGKKSGDIVEKLYDKIKAPKIRTDLKTAEMIKYASNAFLATKITFMNEIGNLCKELGINSYEVADSVGYDKRIGRRFLNSGIGFGGSCFRKDVEAILSLGNEKKSNMSLIKTVLDVNSKQPLKLIDILSKKIKLKGKTIAILGLSFKEDTDDIRDAPSIIIIENLLKLGCKIKAYDPKAMDNMKKIYPKIEYEISAKDAISNSNACLILTEWEEFKNLNDEDFSKMKSKIIVEGRKVLDKSKVSDFEGVCW